MLIVNEKTLALLVLALIVVAAIFLICSIFRLIRWVLRSVWYLLTGKRTRRNDPLKSEDWLVRAQARQEIRFQNSLPPLKPEIKSKKKSFFKRN